MNGNSSNQITTNGNGGSTDVGIWYINYNGGYPDKGWHCPVLQYLPLLSDGTYGYCAPESIVEMDYHLQQLADAKIDFVLMDTTNGGMIGTGYAEHNAGIIKNAHLLCSRIKVWNENPAHAWKIKYAWAIGTHAVVRGTDTIAVCAEKQAQWVSDNLLVSENYNPGDHYRLNGKPLLVLYDWVEDGVIQSNTDSGYLEHFSCRPARNGEAGTYGWQQSQPGGTTLHAEVELVTPGWRNAWSGYLPRDHGNFYRQCWTTVLGNQRPRIVMISSFNDYQEDCAIWTADTSTCIDAEEEAWRDTDGKLSPAMYWEMTKDYIKQLRTA